MPSHIGKTIGLNHPTQYKLQQIIGQGSFGKVYKCGPNQAVKQVLLLNMQPYLRTSLSNEIKILKTFHHPNIVSLYDIIYEDQYVYLVMEYCEMDLAKYIKKYKLDEQKARIILKQIISGFSQLVEKGIIHRDLKPANILVNSKGQFKLADFGFAKFVQHFDTKLLHSIVGTPLYMAPQILKKSKYTTKCDIWSIGYIYFELLTTKVPWTGTSQSNLYGNITKKPLQIPSYISDWSRRLLQKMLVINENDRISWQELIRQVVIQSSQSQSSGKQRSKTKSKDIPVNDLRGKSPSSGTGSGQSSDRLKFKSPSPHPQSNKNISQQKNDLISNQQNNQFLTLKLNQIQQVLELQLLEYFSASTAKQMSTNPSYRFSVDQMIKIKKVLVLLNQSVGNYIKQTYIGMK